MTTQEKEKLAKMLLSMAQIYNRELKDDVIEFYFQTLKDYKYESVERAAMEILRESRFFPTIADFMLKLTPVPDKLRGEKSCASLVDAIKKHGYGSLKLDKKTATVIELMGGIETFWNMKEAEYVHVRKEFVRIFNALNDSESGDNKKVVIKGMFPNEKPYELPDDASDLTPEGRRLQ